MRTMKKLFWAGTFVLALCLPISAETGKDNATNAAPEEPQNPETDKKGVCYRRSGCLASFLEGVTRAECWDNGGNSWKMAKAPPRDCINNQAPE